MNHGQKGLIGLIALGATCLATMTLAPTAQAEGGSYIRIKHSGAFVANTCYDWRGAEKRNYCHTGRPVGDSWLAYLPTGATGALIDLSVWPSFGAKASAVVTDTSQNHCFEISGSALNPTLLETGC
ncbi:hypothetical protein [Wenjunlia tyrosinilytica]|uniref:Uncharacterized protein n=1 Tax=Wenjunlia tyrosinilytica TaxID=1544741 RepID=A0A917ZVZ7_9ACTN|nr:hypothetical protein [Wenjunlia tyrosinilytica]GGO97112.1 hypothetical protein GCM10012280_58140 [Wenjunlia tyrosinilytica]